MTRSYKLKQRGEAQNRTRQKIVEAAIELHQTKGLSATTMRDIAERAEVGRVTVYRHFPDEMALVSACSGAYFQRHPLPDPEPWRSVEDATERTRRGLREAYAFHRSTEAMMTRVYDEARDLPVMAPYHMHWQRAAAVLAEAWPAKGRQRVLRNAALAHALSFDTWRSLVRGQGLSDVQAVDLMLRLACDCSQDSK